MSDLTQMLRAALPHPLTSTTRIVVGYSGGVDSTVLLALLSALRSEAETDKRARSTAPFLLSAVHVHHGLSPHADAWQAHCIAQCAAWNIPLHCECVQLTDPPGASVEARARAARRAVYTRQPGDYLALAHHADDQAETLLYRLIRGSSVTGLSGMHTFASLVSTAPVSRLAGARREEPGGLAVAPLLWRPLLAARKAEIIAYAQAEGLRWIEDESNQNLHHDRNFLRRQVLPILEQRFPHAVPAFARTTQRLAEQGELAEALAQQDLHTAQVKWPDAGQGASFSLDALRVLTPARQCNLLYHFLRQHGLSLEARTLRTLLAQLRDARTDAQPLWQGSGWSLRRFDGRVWLVGDATALPALTSPATARAPARWEISLHDHAPLVLPGWGLGTRRCLVWRAGGGIAGKQITQLAVRPRQGGERLCCASATVGEHHQSVKKLLHAARIPPWERAHWPLVVQGDHVIALPGVRIAQGWWCEDGYFPEVRTADLAAEEGLCEASAKARG